MGIGKNGAQLDGSGAFVNTGTVSYTHLAGSRTDSVRIRTFALSVFIVVVTATVIIGVVIRTEPCLKLISGTGGSLGKA